MTDRGAPPADDIFCCWPSASTVMAYAVATRRRELGIRMAFGAVRQDLIRQVLRGGLTLTTVGCWWD